MHALVFQYTALHIAARAGHTKDTKVLIREGTDLEAGDNVSAHYREMRASIQV